MVAAGGFRVWQQAVAFLIGLAAFFFKLIGILGKVVAVNKVVARIVWRVNVNHFDFAQVAFLQELEHFEVIALNIKVFGVFEIDRFFGNRPKRIRGWQVSRYNGFALAGPLQAVAFFGAFHHFVVEFLAQEVEIDGFAAICFRHTVREKGG